MSSIVNKAKEILHKDKTHEAPEGTHGPHNSRVANTADPRVDSDRDHRAAPTTATGTTGLHEGTYSRPAEGVHAGNYNTAEGVHGPHNSRIANTLDPRVDSDRDNRAAPSAVGTTGGTAGTGYGRTTGTGSTFGTGATTTHGTTGHTGSGVPEGTYGPHSSRLANAADPRVDSDLDSSRGMTGTHGMTGTTGTHGMTGTTGTHGATGTYGSTGTHGTNLGSTTGTHTGTHTGAHTGAHTGTHMGSTGNNNYNTPIGSGPAPNTAGPHKSDMLNKMDPRVDSDMSKTNRGY